MFIIMLLVVLAIALMFGATTSVSGSAEDNALTYYTVPALLLRRSYIERDMIALANEFKQLHSDATFIGPCVEHLNEQKSSPKHLFYAPYMCGGIYSVSESVTKLVRQFNSEATKYLEYLHEYIAHNKPTEYIAFIYLPDIYELPKGSILLPDNGSLNKPCIIIKYTQGDKLSSRTDCLDMLFNDALKRATSELVMPYANSHKDQLASEMSLVEDYIPYLTDASARLPVTEYTFTFKQDIEKGELLLDIMFIRAYACDIVLYSRLPKYIDELKNRFPNVTFTTDANSNARAICYISHDSSELPQPTDRIKYASVKWQVPRIDGLTEYYAGYLHIRPYDSSEYIQLFIGDTHKRAKYDNTKIREQLFRVNVCQREFGYLDDYLYNNNMIS